MGEKKREFPGAPEREKRGKKMSLPPFKGRNERGLMVKGEKVLEKDQLSFSCSSGKEKDPLSLFEKKVEIHKKRKKKREGDSYVKGEEEEGDLANVGSARPGEGEGVLEKKGGDRFRVVVQREKKKRTDTRAARMIGRLKEGGGGG